MGTTFAAEKALSYARAIAFPRKTGTEGEPKAAEAILRILQDFGYEVREEPFSISVSPWVWEKGTVLLFLLFVVLTWLMFGNFPVWAFFFSTASLLTIVLGDRLWMYLGGWVISRESHGRVRSKNIVAHIPKTESGTTVYLVAHYDSKSQSFSLYPRAALFLLGCAAGGVFSLWIWIQTIGRGLGKGVSPLPGFIHALFFITGGLTILFLLTKAGNKSSGSIDNATGVGVLLGMAKALSDKRPEGIRPVFLFTGAEELGLLGAFAFCKRHGLEMLREKALLINIDSVGKKGKMKIGSSGREGKKWLRKILGIARDKGFTLKNLPFLKGIFMDHLPFCRNGISSVSLTSVSREGWHLHTRRDRFSLVQKDGLEEMGRFILTLLQGLESKS